MRILRCSFCHKTQDEVRKLISGPDALICNECIEVASAIVDDQPSNTPATDSNLARINARLKEEIIGLRETIANPAKLQHAISLAEKSRLYGIIKAVGIRATGYLKKTSPEVWCGYHYTRIARYLEPVFLASLHSETSALLKAAQVKPADIAAAADLKTKRAVARRQLAAELKSGRSRLREISARLHQQEERLRIASEAMLHRSEYPEIPLPLVESSEDGTGLPDASGIYFVWAGGTVVYVGQSVKICNRARARHHHAIQHGEWLSWIPVPLHDLNWAESFYIGACRPYRNFGGRRREAQVSAATGNA